MKRRASPHIPPVVFPNGRIPGAADPPRRPYFMLSRHLWQRVEATDRIRREHHVPSGAERKRWQGQATL
jgi:hypothetical protein